MITKAKIHFSSAQRSSAQSCSAQRSSAGGVVMIMIKSWVEMTCAQNEMKLHNNHQTHLIQAGAKSARHSLE